MVLALPVVVIIAVVVGGVIWSRQQPASATEPLAVAAVPAPGAAGKYCSTLKTALPATLDGRPQRSLVGDGTGTAAWGDPAVVLRCGLPTPVELTCSAALTVISSGNSGVAGVQWLQLSEGGQSTYIAADRPVRVAVTLPDKAGTAAIQDLSSVIAGVLPSTVGADGKVCTDGKLPATDDS